MVFEWATQSPYTGGNVIFIETYRGYDIYFLDHWGLMFYAIVDPDGVELNIFHSTLSYIKNYIDSIAPEPGEPDTQITDFIIPTSLPAGTPIGELTVVTRNAGTAAGYLEVGINSDKYTVAYGSSYPTQVAPGDTFTFYLTPEIEPNMPNEDYTLTATNYEGTSYITKTILLEVAIPTILTITAPDTINEGEMLDVITRLTTQAGEPLAGMETVLTVPEIPEIILRAYTGVDGTCDFMLSLNQGTYTLRADFAGTEAYNSSRAMTTIFATSPMVATIQIAGSIATGLALFIYGTR